MQPEQKPPVTQPTSVPQPKLNVATAQGMRAPTKENLKKQMIAGYIFAVVSIIWFIVSFTSGYATGAPAILGAFALLFGIKSKNIPLIVLGSIGLALNFAIYTFAIFS